MEEMSRNETRRWKEVHNYDTPPPEIIETDVPVIFSILVHSYCPQEM
jgi:hypothetical protein